MRMGDRCYYPALVLLWACGTVPHASVSRSTAQEVSDPVIWSLGELDGSAIEFAPGSKKEVTFKVGENVLSRDFPGLQEGTQGWAPEDAGEKPYTLQFDLPRIPAESCYLRADLIFPSGAPTHIRVAVNGRRGVYPVRVEPKRDLDGKDGNMMLLARQRLTVPVDVSWLQSKDNRITIVPVGFGALVYDALSLREGLPPEGGAWGEARLEPTVFFYQDQGRLVEECRLLVPFRKRFEQGRATVQLGRETLEIALEADEWEFGVLSQPIRIEARDEEVDVTIQVTLDGQRSRVTHRFRPAKRWQLFICPKIHNDVGFTDVQPHVNELDTRNTDTVLSILEQFSFYKFNFETSWLVDNFLDCRPEKYRREFYRRAAEGRAAINAFYLNLMTGICSGEELYRALYFSHALHLEHDSDFNFACLTDAPSHSWFLPTLLTDVGIQVFSNGSNQARAPILVFSDLNEQSPFYWEGVNGERIMMWYARVYAQWKILTSQGFIGSGASYDYLKRTVPQFLTRYRRADYAPDAVMVYGAYVDNAAIPATAEAEFVEKWNAEFAFPRLIVAADSDYYQYIHENFADKLPVYRGDAGAYWEDGVASSAEATSWNRRTKSIVAAAETSASLATIFEPRYRYPAEDFRAVWQNVLFYDEHTWGAFNSVSQPDRDGVLRQWEIKESYARRGNLDARNLMARALNRLCQQMAVKNNMVFAFNWQFRKRTEPIVTELGEGTVLVDLATGESVATDTILQKDGWKRVRFLAEDVPAIGYRGYEIRFLDPPEKLAAPTTPPENWTIENDHYRLSVDPQTGGIQSLIDKSVRKELVDQQAAYSLNQYLYVSGGENSLILDLTFGSAPAELTVHRPRPARIVEHVETPLGPRLVVETSAENTPKIRSEYLLYDKIRRIDIVNALEKTATRDKEAVYFAFPFAAKKPACEYQIQNGWVRPNQDQLPGACREWFTPQNVVRIRDGKFSIAWASPDAPLVTLTDINRGLWPQHLEMTNGHLFSYVMNNYWFVNYKAMQGGDFTFRYSLTSGDEMRLTELADFDADTRSPVLAYPYLSSFSASVKQEDRRLPPSSGSFLQLDAANLQLVMLKQAEDEDGFIMRLLETAGQGGEAKLTSAAFAIRAAYLCNGVEVNRRELATTSRSVTIPYGPNQYTTVRIQFDGPK